MRRGKLRRALGCALAGLAGAAMYMSWGALYESAKAVGGMSDDRAFVFPAIVDVVTVVAMLVIVFVDTTPGVRRFAWATFWLFGVVTVLGNAAHVATIPADELALGVAVAVVVNSLPGVALLMLAHLASLMLRTPEPEPEFVELEAVQLEAAPAPRARAPRRPRAATSDEEVDREAARKRAEELRSSTTLSIGEIAAEVRVPKATVGRWLAPAGS